MIIHDMKYIAAPAKTDAISVVKESGAITNPSAYSPAVITAVFTADGTSDEIICNTPLSIIRPITG